MCGWFFFALCLFFKRYKHGAAQGPAFNRREGCCAGCDFRTDICFIWGRQKKITEIRQWSRKNRRNRQVERRVYSRHLLRANWGLTWIVDRGSRILSPVPAATPKGGAPNKHKPPSKKLRNLYRFPSNKVCLLCLLAIWCLLAGNVPVYCVQWSLICAASKENYYQFSFNVKNVN